MSFWTASSCESWVATRNYNLPAPGRADGNYLRSYATVMGDITRPAWNAWTAQNAENLRAQGYGAGAIRDRNVVQGRDDMRDLRAMGRFVEGGVKGLINDLAATAQMGSLAMAYRWATGTEVWQPFELNGSVEKAGAISFGVASIFVGGAGTAARSTRMLPNPGALERVAPHAISDLRLVAKPEKGMIVYRALTAQDAAALKSGTGLIAKAPDGTWTAAEHVANQGVGEGGAAMNSPWISTTKKLEVARAYDSGHGIVAIDLGKADTAHVEVWKTAPRVNGRAGLPCHRSIWAQEVTVFQSIPERAIIGAIE
ncbi:hypothetical protein [Stenotrophomonas pavanii]|uniref:hypothetical protein n=2 Tax=Stenotrophomonas pavanii TaxID=487698 RepID=UPI001364D2E2|nr:hypothetical protein [Stenotrophomonas pavanii]